MIKGTYGYLGKKKRFQLLYTIGIVILSLLIFFIGYQYSGTTKNLFTVVAVLGVLPGTKALIGFITVCPFRPITTNTYEMLSKYEQEPLRTYYDMVFTSTETVMHLSYLCVSGTELIAYQASSSKKDEKILAYFTDSLKKRGIAVHMHIFTDFRDLEKRLATAPAQEEVPEEVVEFIRMILV